MQSFYEFNTHGNLSLCYYFKRDTSEAIKVLSRLFLKDVYPKFSTENQFSISIIEIILHYENANLDYVTYRIGEIRRQFKTLLKDPLHQEEKAFLKILLNMRSELLKLLVTLLKFSCKYLKLFFCLFSIRYIGHCRPGKILTV